MFETPNSPPLVLLIGPTGTPSTSVGRKEDKGKVIGLGIGLGVCGVLLVLLILLGVYREKKWEKRELGRERDEEQKGGKVNKGRFGKGGVDLNLLVSDVSDCLDKYKVYGIEELKEATDGFDDKWVIHGSVYKGYIGGGLHAIKRMKWNACEELKILQKVYLQTSHLWPC